MVSLRPHTVSPNAPPLNRISTARFVENKSGSQTEPRSAEAFLSQVWCTFSVCVWMCLCLYVCLHVCPCAKKHTHVSRWTFTNGVRSFIFSRWIPVFFRLDGMDLSNQSSDQVKNSRLYCFAPQSTPIRVNGKVAKPNHAIHFVQGLFTVKSPRWRHWNIGTSTVMLNEWF